VYTSNVFAILGLRALYFALAGIMQLFHHLHYGLSAILVFVGIKMVAVDIFGKIPTGVSLGVIAVILALSVIASLHWPKKAVSPPALPERLLVRSSVTTWKTRMGPARVTATWPMIIKPGLWVIT
jgi:tellurite resistance protein TerC